MVGVVGSNPIATTRQYSSWGRGAGSWESLRTRQANQIFTTTDFETRRLDNLKSMKNQGVTLIFCFEGLVPEGQNP